MPLRKENNARSEGIKMTILGRRFHNASEGNYTGPPEGKFYNASKGNLRGPSEGKFCNASEENLWGSFRREILQCVRRKFMP